MKQNSTLILRWVLASSYFLSIFIYLTVVVQPELYYHLHQPAFFSDWGFFSEYLTYPGGVAQYLTNVMSQFFYFGWPGSLVIILVGFLLSLSIYHVLSADKKSVYNYFWSVIPFILLMALIHNYYFQFSVAVKVLIAYAASWLLIFARTKKADSFLCFAIIAPLVYFLAGNGYLVAFTITVIISFLGTSANVKQKLLFLILSLLYTFLLEFAFYKFVFSIPPYDAYFSLLPEIQPDYLVYIPKMGFYLFCFSLPVISLLFLLKRSIFDRLLGKKRNSKEKSLDVFSVNSIFFIIILILTIFLFYKSFEKHRKNIILADYYCYNEKWDDVIKVAKADREYDVSMNLNFNRAIDNSGHYLDMFFDYPQLMGANALYPDMLESPQLAAISSDYYFDLGHILESQHWAFESLIINQYNIRHLKRLVITNLIFKNYNAAEKYFGILKGNFIAKDFVKKYQPYFDDTTLVNKDELIMKKRSLIPSIMHLSDIIVDRFYDLISKNPQNQKAYEHLQMYLLLDQQLGQFMSNLNASCKFYSQIPEIYQHAVILYAVMTDIKKLKDFNLSKSSAQVFTEFTNILKQYGKDPETSKPFFKDYANTYMYYITFDSPKVTKAELTRARPDEYY